LEKHPEDDDHPVYDKYEICAEVYKEKVLKKAKRKRKKRYGKMWNNCVPLTRYKGCLFINQEMISERREKRYQEEKFLYGEFVISRREKKIIKTTFKDVSLKSYYGKPYESKYESLGYERDERTFDQSSSVDGSDVAAESEYSAQNRICRQNSAIECTNSSMIGTTSLTSGTNPNDYAEEVIPSKGFGKYFMIRDLYVFIPKSLKKKFKKISLIESKCFRLDNLDCECEAQTINHSSTVDGSGVAAESEYSTQKRICKQSPAVECNNNLVNETICLSSETDPKSPADLFCIDVGSESLEKFFSQVFVNEVVCLESKLPVINLLDPNDPSNLAHDPTSG
jgi:hypothetical protein